MRAVCVCFVAQLCLTLCCDTMDCSLPGSSVRGILQARILEWAAISFSRGSSWPRDWTRVSCTRRQILYHLSHQGSPGKSLKKILKQFICSNQDQPPIHSWQLINKFLKTFKTSQIPLFSCFSSCNCLVQFPSLDFTHGTVLCCFLDFLSIES